jgi:hypothetical protein
MATKAQKDGMAWFKKQFGSKIKAAIKDTPFTVDLLTAIAVQESFEAWGLLYKKEKVDKVLELCVGDSIGQPKRKAFPRTKTELLNYKPPNGAELFALAREYLKAFGQFNKVYMKQYNQGKFCHAFGIFQYDIQHFKDKPAYFLKKQWLDFDVCADRVINELKTAQKGARLAGKKTLTDLEQCFVAIVYNMGAKKFRASKGLKQGHKSDGKFYGQYIADYLAAAKAIPES